MGSKYIVPFRRKKALKAGFFISGKQKTSA
jgi:hypothetical protein